MLLNESPEAIDASCEVLKAVCVELRIPVTGVGYAGLYDMQEEPYFEVMLDGEVSVFLLAKLAERFPARKVVVGNTYDEAVLRFYVEPA